MRETEAARLVERIARVIRRVIGVPDYELYLRHARRCHPADAPMSPEAFAADALARRYERPGSRCC
ncbi:MAG: YbdD/YjiX family protein [Gemmatimonadaceae bacterium]